MKLGLTGKILGLTCMLALAFAWGACGDTFKRHSQHYQVGPNPNALVAVDLNGDGLPEILTANTGQMGELRQERPANDEVSFLLATEALEYETQPPLRTGFGPYAIAIANVDALKAPDILVAAFLATRNRDITVFKNMGENLFEPAVFAVPDDTIYYHRVCDGDDKPVFTEPGLTALALSDFNGDRLRDLVAAGWSSDVLVFMPGDAESLFQAPQFIQAPGGPRDLVITDLDGDGDKDVAVALYSTHEIGFWLWGHEEVEEGSFERGQRFHSRGQLPSRIKAKDVNGDDRVDLIVSHCYSEDSVVIFYGDKAHTFSVSQEVLVGEDRSVLEHEIRDLVVEDLNGDGRTDLAVACAGSSKVCVFLNASEESGIPQVFEREEYDFEEASPRALCVADFNQDGAPDLGVALWEANAVTMLLGKPPKE